MSAISFSRIVAALLPQIKHLKKNGVNEINTGINSSIVHSRSLFVCECISPDKEKNIILYQAVFK